MDNILTAAELNIIPVRIPAKVTAEPARGLPACRSALPSDCSTRRRDSDRRQQRFSPNRCLGPGGRGRVGRPRGRFWGQKRAYEAKKRPFLEAFYLFSMTCLGPAPVGPACPRFSRRGVQRGEGGTWPGHAGLLPWNRYDGQATGPAAKRMPKSFGVRHQCGLGS